MKEETKQLILEATKKGICKNKASMLKSIPKTVKGSPTMPPGSAPTMTSTPNVTPA